MCVFGTSKSVCIYDTSKNACVFGTSKRAGVCLVLVRVRVFVWYQ